MCYHLEVDNNFLHKSFKHLLSLHRRSQTQLLDFPVRPGSLLEVHTLYLLALCLNSSSFPRLKLLGLELIRPKTKTAARNDINLKTLKVSFANSRHVKPDGLA